MGKYEHYRWFWVVKTIGKTMVPQKMLGSYSYTFYKQMMSFGQPHNFIRFNCPVSVPLLLKGYWKKKRLLLAHFFFKPKEWRIFYGLTLKFMILHWNLRPWKEKSSFGQLFNFIRFWHNLITLYRGSFDRFEKMLGHSGHRFGYQEVPLFHPRYVTKYLDRNFFRKYSKIL